MEFKSRLLSTSFLLPLLIGSFNLPFISLSASAVSRPHLIATASSRQTETKRIALVVGIDDYPENPLQLPVRDAELITKQLKSVGFEVILIKNPTLGALEEARDTFIKKIENSSQEVTALFFFAGHAVQFDGHNYLIPSKSNILSSSTLPSKAAFVDKTFDAQKDMLNYLNGSNAAQVIFILDACRVNPFDASHRAGLKNDGLADMNTAPGGPETVIFFAAEPTRVAYDAADNSQNSPFTQAFSYAISQPGLKLADIATIVQTRVKKSTNGFQIPYFEGVFPDFKFREAKASLESDSKQSKLLETEWTPEDYDKINTGFDLLNSFLEEGSIEDLQKAAEGGDAEAQYLLALAYNKGEGVATDPKLTAYWLRKSATRGFSRAQFAYGQRLYWGWGGIEPQKEDGFEWWLLAAENGNASAMLEIGDTHRWGREGVSEKNLDKAENYYRQALAADHAEAETALGNLFSEIASSAKKEGDIDGFNGASERSFSYYTEAARKKSPQGMYKLANLYRYGSDYIEVDKQKAVTLYEQSAIAGNVWAAEDLASLYSDEEKTGLEQPNHEKAAKYYRIAIDLDSKTARVRLADLIRNGKVTPKTPDEALNLYEQGFANNSVQAASRLSDVYFKGTLAPKDFERSEQYALSALKFFDDIDMSSEDAYPPYRRSAIVNLVKLYTEEGFTPTSSKLLDELTAEVPDPNGSMKRFTIPVICGSLNSPFFVYIWDWKLDEPPTNSQFRWLKAARGCETPVDVVESFEKLYKIAKENNVSYTELTVYALGNAAKENDDKSSGDQK